MARAAPVTGIDPQQA